MSKELIISYNIGGTKIAILNNGILEELHESSDDNSLNVGNIYIGRVRKLKPELNSCFIDIGEDKDGFLHYHDLGKQLKSLLKFINQAQKGTIKHYELNTFSFEQDINKDGQIQDLFKQNDRILVQVSKEPISTKGPRLTSDISLAGRFIILNPFGDKISVSKNIKNQTEKDRLKNIIAGIKPIGFGIIIRTVAEGKQIEELHEDLNFLLKKWERCFYNISKNKTPYKILSELDKAQSILRDNFNEDYNSIICDDYDFSEQLKDYLKIIAPEKDKIVKYYDSHVPLFEHYSIERKIKQAFGKYVNIPNSKGAYLVIEHTEALHVIDVNSGTTNTKEKTQEQTAIAVNLLAATEIARQLKLRDMGGIIIVDFIDMTSLENRKILYEHLRTEMQKDKAKHKVLQPSKFGIIQITRQRVRPQKVVSILENNPNNGQIEAPILTIEHIENSINKIIHNNKHTGKIYLHIHPFISAYLKIGFPSIRLKWFFKFKKWIIIVERDAYKYLEFSFYNGENKIINY